jgi:hypothetical protein
VYWACRTSKATAGSLAGKAVDNEIMGQLIHTKMRLAEIEEEMDNLRNELTKAHKEKSRSQQQVRSVPMVWNAHALKPSLAKFTESTAHGHESD